MLPISFKFISFVPSSFFFYHFCTALWFLFSSVSFLPSSVFCRLQFYDFLPFLPAFFVPLDPLPFLPFLPLPFFSRSFKALRTP